MNDLRPLSDKFLNLAHRCTRLIFVLQVLAACFVAPVFAQPNVSNPAFNPQQPLQTMKEPGQWTTCVVSDARGIFVGTQSDGIWFQSAADQQWWHFTTREGLGADDITALCIDASGRLWAGHGRNGVSVGNGKSWRNFPAHSAPFGAHVNALTATKTGEIWVAGEANLAVFDGKNQWRVPSTPRELPAQQITVLNSNEEGTIFAGTQTSGLWLSHDDNHQNWQHSQSATRMPDSATGAGLPGNEINAILCAGQNIWVGTNNGLALSSDKGTNWTFRRGANWEKRLWGLAQIVAPKGDLINGALLRDDWVESLGLSASGDLIIGYRNGYEIRSPDAETIVETILNEGQLVRSITQNTLASTCIASFGAGAFQVGKTRTPANIVDKGAPLPPASQVPTAENLNALAVQLEAWPEEAEFRARALPDDWTTRGDWVGRYGRYWAVMCALNSPSDYVWGGFPYQQNYRVSGGRMTPGDSMRFYIHELYSTDPNALELPQVYLDARLKLNYLKDPTQNRRIAEWNDNGHEYPTTSDGPNLYLALDILPGDFVFSLYDWNKDERSGPNARRDFTLSLRERPDNITATDDRATNYEQFESWPELAHGRLQKFGSGVYTKVFSARPAPRHAANRAQQFAQHAGDGRFSRPQSRKTRSLFSDRNRHH